MQILIVRHAIAADPDPARFSSDAERPLTDKGRSRMVEGAAGLIRLLERPDAIFTSPFVRAAETAAILSAAWGGKPRPEPADLLAPGHTPLAVVRWLLGDNARARVVLVGHEPGCSALLAFLIARDGTAAAVEFKKGAAALVDTTARAGRLHGTLAWHASPRLLRLAAR